MGFTSRTVVIEYENEKKSYYEQVQEHLKELEAMGFAYPASSKKKLEQMDVEELISGGLKPESDLNWPKEFKDLPLGKLVERARHLNRTIRK